MEARFDTIYYGAHVAVADPAMFERAAVLSQCDRRSAVATQYKHVARRMQLL